MDRLSREGYFMENLALLERRSTCNRGQVGAIVVRENRIISSGYNGAPPGRPHCLDVGCEEEMLYEIADTSYPGSVDYIDRPSGCTRAIHAESNALLWAARKGIRTEEAEMWGSYAPCRSCAMEIVAAGITKFTYLKPYRADRLDILEDALVEVIHHT